MILPRLGTRRARNAAVRAVVWTVRQPSCPARRTVETGQRSSLNLSGTTAGRAVSTAKVHRRPDLRAKEPASLPNGGDAPSGSGLGMVIAKGWGVSTGPSCPRATKPEASRSGKRFTAKSVKTNPFTIPFLRPGAAVTVVGRRAHL